jgi:hypothetical protein
MLVVAFVLGWGTFAILHVVTAVGSDPMNVVVFGLASLLFTALGGLILARVPGNRLGWVIATPGLTIVWSAVAGQLADLGVQAVIGLSGALWFATYALVGYLTLWFPTGRPPTRRWRWVEWLGHLVMATLLFLSLFAERLCLVGGSGRCETYVDNPIGIAGVPDLEYQAGPVTLVLFMAFLGAGSLSIVVRLIRSRGAERLQLKWFAFSVAMLFGWIIVSEAMTALVGSGFDEAWISDVIFGAVFLGVPVSAVVAVLRYRLYDIDRIISRTVSYALVVGLLAALYVGAVSILTQALPVESDLAVAGATLAVVVVFAPVRRTVQGIVDRRFNRTRYVADQELAAFAHRVRDTTDLAVIESDVRILLARTLEPTMLDIWLSARETD